MRRRFVVELNFSPDGSRLAIPFGLNNAEGPDGIEVRDVRSGERLARLPSAGEVRSVAFSGTVAYSRAARWTAAPFCGNRRLAAD